MTLTDISERIRDHLLNQRSRSVSHGSLCCYHGDDGNMCAVGCLLGGFYDGAMEGQTVNTTIVFNAVVDSCDYTGDRTKLLEALCAWQRYHDHRVNLEGVSKAFGYGEWLAENGDVPDSMHSPARFHEYLVRNLL